MRKVGRLGAACILLTVLLSGCGQGGIPENVQEPTLAVTDGGQVTACMVGQFDKFYYDLDELAKMARAEAAAYGGALGEKAPVRVDGVKASDDGDNHVIVTYIFDSPESYEDFLRTVLQFDELLFYGTVSEAFAQGYGDGVTLKSVKDDTIMTGAELAQNQEKHLIIYRPDIEEPSEDSEKENITHVTIYCPEEVEYVSQGADINQDGSVDTIWTEGDVYEPVYILLRK